MKKVLRSPVMTGFLFVLAVVMLFAGTIGGTQAALSVRSEDYYSALATKHIGVSLIENGRTVGARAYGTAASAGESGWVSNTVDGDITLNKLQKANDAAPDTVFKLGKDYPFELRIQNTGTIPQYARVIVYRYWVRNGKTSGHTGNHLRSDWIHEGDKILDTRFKTEYIITRYGTAEYNSANWIKGASTDEREVYYYSGQLAVGERSEPLFTTLRIDPAIAKIVNVNTQVTTSGNTTYYEYTFDDCSFIIEAEVDAVQTHNAEDAVRSAWGVAEAIPGITG